MSLKERLSDLSGAVASAMVYAHDEYPEWRSYEAHREDLYDLWAEIRPKLKRDLERAEYVDRMLREMIGAFDAGEKERGRKLACDLYNFDIEKLR
ncbi:hypothetical protein [Pandoraea sp. NPDC087047]|uniref:hypothetical protein n=1 Tax=Pandoraea sp. NPDC087047 TaxID=3364390 RepID=UPI003822FB91